MDVKGKVLVSFKQIQRQDGGMGLLPKATISTKQKDGSFASVTVDARFSEKLASRDVIERSFKASEYYIMEVSGFLTVNKGKDGINRIGLYIESAKTVSSGKSPEKKEAKKPGDALEKPVAERQLKAEVQPKFVPIKPDEEVPF